MSNASSLPPYLIQRYETWKTKKFEENKGRYKKLAKEGQHPQAMIISCCDSRVHATAIFGSETGEFFIHRNIANLVPPYNPDGDHHGTSAAVEYAVTVLEVPHIMVLGHSHCGGVNACHKMCSGNAPELEGKSSFIGQWMDILRPGYERVQHIESSSNQIAALEKEGVVISLENLMTFPFVKIAVERGSLSLHGLWTDIGEGTLFAYDGIAFQPVLL